MKLLFVHIPKTAGTSLIAELDDILGPGMSIFRGGHFDGLLGFETEDIAAVLNHDFVRGHLRLHLLEGTGADLSRVFTLLRDPVERVYSMYHFFKSHDPAFVEAAGDAMAPIVHSAMASENIVDWIAAHPGDPDIFDGQTEYLKQRSDAHGVAALESAMRALDAMLCFGLAERYEDSMFVLAKCLSLPRPIQPRRANAANAPIEGVRSAYRIERTERFDQAIREANQLDQELYAHAQRGFEARLGMVRRLCGDRA